MLLSVGEKLGPYEILAPVGAGGMGEVYRARDTRLHRDVAIKVSSERYSERFEKEARAIAALNHPNVCTLHDIGPNYLVMELIEGPTLADRIKQGAIPLEEALAIARQIADALDAAHQRGIVHRDLKPANINVSESGTVKVLDFGLAKATETTAPSGDPSASPTLTLEVTRAGMILGTAAYMAPEQARGKAVDKRADIWAFGVVLYEMLTGKSLFKGEDASETLAAVIKQEPDLSGVPREVRRLLQSCLEKQPAKRLRDIGDVWKLLETAPVATVDALAHAHPRHGIAGWIVAGLLALSLASLWLFEWRRGAHSDLHPLANLTMELTPTERLANDTFGRPSRTGFAITPDGETVVFSGVGGAPAPGLRFYPGAKLYRRNLGQTESVAIPGTEGAVEPFLSPDGKWAGFWSEGKLKKVSLSGGPPFTICDASFIWGASWSSTDMIAGAVPGGDLMQVSAKGGTPQLVVKRDPSKGEYISAPAFLPDGKTLLYTLRTSDDWTQDEIILRRLDTGEQRVLIHGGADARYVSSGHLVYVNNGTLMAVAFDLRRMQLSGAPVAMVDGVMQAVNEPNTGSESGIGQFATSDAGNLVYAGGGIYPAVTRTVVRVDRNGTETESSISKGVYSGARVSPDGRRVAIQKYSDTSLLADIWVFDLLTGKGTRLTSQGRNVFPLWSPDGRRLLYAGGAGFTKIFSIPTDGSGAAETILTSNTSVVPAAWSPDGTLAYIASNEFNHQIMTRSISGSDAPKKFSDSDFDFGHPAFSPDGRWVAYVSNETGRTEVWVRPFPGPGEKYRVSPDGGVAPVWARSQRELFYIQPGGGKAAMMAVEIAPGAVFKSGQPHKLFDSTFLNTLPLRSWDLLPDGQHFIGLRVDPSPVQPVVKLNVVLNWFDELRRRAPVGK